MMNLKFSIELTGLTYLYTINLNQDLKIDFKKIISLNTKYVYFLHQNYLFIVKKIFTFSYCSHEISGQMIFLFGFVVINRSCILIKESFLTVSVCVCLVVANGKKNISNLDKGRKTRFRVHLILLFWIFLLDFYLIFYTIFRGFFPLDKRNSVSIF